jgi:hypothetical protein
MTTLVIECQVILVRDDASKDKLQTQIGEIALVLTILESKGMEPIILAERIEESNPAI